MQSQLEKSFFHKQIMKYEEVNKIGRITQYFIK